MCGTLLMLLYAVFAVAMTRADLRSSRYTAVRIDVADSAHTGFVTPADIDRGLGDITGRCRTVPRSAVNTLDLQRRLQAMPSIEEARVVALADGSLRISVVPMQPVARVLDRNRSYYINSTGKTIDSHLGNHVDVPVVMGHFGSGKEVAALLPMFSFIHANPNYDALVTSVTVSPRGDIIVVPAVTGHVINLGDTTMIADKLERVSRFYREVMPVKGWQYYDTLSVKFRGRLVATRARKRPAGYGVTVVVDSLINDIPDDGSMELADGSMQAAITLAADSARRHG